MKKFLVFAVFLLFAALQQPQLAVAQVVDLIQVDFAATPLFDEAKILPGDAIGRTATVTNVSAETQAIEFRFDNIIDGDLANVMELAVTSGAVVYQFDTFDTLFSEGPYSLGSLAPGDSRAYTFYAAFPPESGNEYQLTTFQFDLIIGAKDGTQVSDGGGSSGSGGSVSLSGGDTETLQLFNETATVVEALGGAFVTWDSNLPASSYLVCAAVDDTAVPLSAESPLFGYEFSLPERFDDAKIHGFVLNDLEPGSYECRPAGRLSMDGAYTVGDPVRFTIPAPPAGQVAGASTDGLSLEDLLAMALTTDLPPQPYVVGASKSAGTLTYDEFKAEMDQKNAAKLAAAAITDPVTAADAESSTDVAAAAEAADYSTPEGVKENLSFAWWPWVLGILVMMLLVWFLNRRDAG